MDEDHPQNVSDILEEMMYGGKEGVAKRRRSATLEYERELAQIRRDSHALIWTGTAEQLIAIITAWYEAGLIQADNLQNALEKAATHFVAVSGARIITLPSPESTPEPTVKKDAAVFSHSYQWVRFRGQDL